MQNVHMYAYIHTYHIASNYGQSYINACSRLVAEANGIITKRNAESRLNAGSFMDPYWKLYLHGTSKTFPQFPPSSSNMIDARQQMTEPLCVIKYHMICKSISNRVRLESFFTATVNSWCELASRLLQILQDKLFSFY